MIETSVMNELNIQEMYFYKEEFHQFLQSDGTFTVNAYLFIKAQKWFLLPSWNNFGQMT